jgi:lipopolysaccharide/colanic/teichoic acid biosynthesis glycosyltransferase/GGDEF domain-containing protein
VWSVPTLKLHSRNGTNGVARAHGFANCEILGRTDFLKMLCLERKRTERSGRRFVLMLLAFDDLLRTGRDDEVLSKVLSVLSRSTRATDVKGWYTEGSIIGVIFTEVGQSDGKHVAQALLAKVTGALSDTLTVDEISDVHISFHTFPENWDKHGPNGPADPLLYPDTSEPSAPSVTPRLLKRTVDIAGSLCALVLLSPVFLAVSIMVKLTSPGPVLFRQRRLGQYGRAFTFLKFRSMYTAGDQQIHQDYIKKFIAGASAKELGGSQAVFKITNDPRVTRIGRFLRKTSLDELPQFLNVLAGQMSLVGPRPPIPYEAQCYDIWHRRRLLAVKPGITGLWQVAGRSRVSFDEMVRLDLTYATSWSGWLDTKILLQTPIAVFSGTGAY